MAFLVHTVDEPSGAPKRENIQRREHLQDAMKLAQTTVKDRLRGGYRHAEFIDQWTILKDGASVFRVRIEDSRQQATVRVAEPLLWSPHSIRT